jgi:hypothetical protein
MAHPNFQDDIRPLFRDGDVTTMKDQTAGFPDPPGQLDLSSCESVRKWGERVLEKLESGDMPCDAPWPKEQVDVFRQWKDSGYPCE